MVLAQLANLRNDRTNFLQSMLALYLFASKVSQRAMTCLNHMGLSVSITSLRSCLRSAARSALKQLQKLASSGMAFLTVIDNLTKQTNVRYRRLCNDPDFLTLTAGFILVASASRSRKMFTREDFRQHLVPHLTIADFLPTSTHQENQQS